MQRTVQILTADAEPSGPYLRAVYDADSETYFAPDPSPELVAFMKAERARLGVERFTGAGTKTAIIDTGMLSLHPWIAPRLVGSMDFTGEGPEDLNGHGTQVALLTVLWAPGTELLNVKVIGADGFGDERWLVEGIDWAVSQGCDSINISAGVYRKKWGILPCDGTCRVCKAATSAARAGVLVVAAAGNTPRMTACPASAGVRRRAPIVALASWDLGKQAPASYSGRGNVFAPAVDGKIRMRPVR